MTNYLTMKQAAAFVKMDYETFRYHVNTKDDFPVHIVLGQKAFIGKELKKYKFKDGRKKP